MAGKKTIEIKAIELVMAYEKKQGRQPRDVSKIKDRFKGFDIISFDKSKNKDIRTIEVKGTTNYSVPDSYETDFTRTNRLVADFLYVVVYSKSNKNRPELFVVPSTEIKPEHLTEKIMIHFKSGFNKILLSHEMKLGIKKKNNKKK